MRPVVKLLLRPVVVRTALVVAEIEVRLGAVVRHEHLAVLERAHGAGIDVDVGIELDEGDPEPARLENAPSEAAAIPFPSEETTPPVTQINLVMGATVAGIARREGSLADQVV